MGPSHWTWFCIHSRRSEFSFSLTPSLTWEHSSSARSRAACRGPRSAWPSGVCSEIWPTGKKANRYTQCTQEMRVGRGLMITGRLSTYILYEQRVAGYPLHGLQEEAGQRHSFTPVISGYLLLERRRKTISLHLTAPVSLLLSFLQIHDLISHTLRKFLKSGWSWVLLCSRAAAFSWQEQKRMYGCMCASSEASRSPISWTGMFSPPAFLRAHKALRCTNDAWWNLVSFSIFLR